MKNDPRGRGISSIRTQNIEWDWNAIGGRAVLAHLVISDRFSHEITVFCTLPCVCHPHRLSTDFGRLVGEVSALRSAAAGIQRLSYDVSTLKSQIAQKLSSRLVNNFQRNSATFKKKFWLRNGKLEWSHPLPFHFIPSQLCPFLNHLTIEFRSDQTPIP
jgi:hypothetical protein